MSLPESAKRCFLKPFRLPPTAPPPGGAQGGALLMVQESQGWAGAGNRGVTALPHSRPPISQSYVPLFVKSVSSFPQTGRHLLPNSQDDAPSLFR